MIIKALIGNEVWAYIEADSMTVEQLGVCFPNKIGEKTIYETSTGGNFDPFAESFRYVSDDLLSNKEESFLLTYVQWGDGDMGLFVSGGVYVMNNSGKTIDKA
jgi:hypothetical protein